MHKRFFFFRTDTVRVILCVPGMFSCADTRNTLRKVHRSRQCVYCDHYRVCGLLSADRVQIHFISAVQQAFRRSKTLVFFHAPNFV